MSNIYDQFEGLRTTVRRLRGITVSDGMPLGTALILLSALDELIDEAEQNLKDTELSERFDYADGFADGVRSALFILSNQLEVPFSEWVKAGRYEVAWVPYGRDAL